MNVVERILERIKELHEDIRITELDLNAKLRRHDRHGVRDAVVDIEVAEAQVKALEQVVEWLGQ